MYILGIDIGGTKCAAVTAEYTDGNITLIKKEKCATDLKISPTEMIQKLFTLADSILDKKPDAIGISCGGPLDSKKGIVKKPPSLPLWDNIEVVKYFEDKFNIQKYINGLAAFIKDCEVPMTIAVQGDWGTGKTSIMEMVRKELTGVKCVWFNTWQYSQFNMGDALAVSFDALVLNAGVLL